MNDNPGYSACWNCDSERKVKFRNLETNYSNKSEVCCICKKDLASESKIKLQGSETAISSGFDKVHKFIILGILVGAVCITFFLSYESNETSIEDNITILKQRYISQKQILWNNVYKILSDSTSPIQSLILLHKDQGDTAVKFAKDLINMLSKIKKSRVVVEYEVKKNFIDYGQELVHYLEKVKENKNLIVPKLEEIPVERVTMFHFLCDESLSSHGPLYYVFTLKDTSVINSDSSKNINPLGKAGQILRNTWSSLPGNELYPLISRIARNVVEILPENINF